MFSLTLENFQTALTGAFGVPARCSRPDPGLTGRHWLAQVVRVAPALL